MKCAITYWLIIACVGVLIPQASASGGGGHGGGGHGSSGGHASGSFHGSFGHSSPTWGGLHSAPSYHGFSSKPSGPFTVGRLGASRPATSLGSGHYTPGYSAPPEGASATGSYNSGERVPAAEALGPLRELDPGPAPIPNRLPVDTASVNEFVPVLEPEFAPVAPPLSSVPIKDDEFWLMGFGGLLLLGVGGYLRYRHWTRQRQLLVQAVADAPTYPPTKAIRTTEDFLVSEAETESRILKVYRKLPSRISKK